jgi:hypothetical protein
LTILFAGSFLAARNLPSGDKDLLQHIDLARNSFGEVIPLRRDARRVWFSSREHG